jgi:hypothetical protein
MAINDRLLMSILMSISMPLFLAVRTFWCRAGTELDLPRAVAPMADRAPRRVSQPVHDDEVDGRARPLLLNIGS